MSLTAGQLIAGIRHRIAGPVGSELGGGTRVINLAGQWLDGIHAWQQRLRVSAALHFAAGDTFLALPANLRSIVAVEQSGITDGGRTVSWIGPGDMLSLRQDLSDFGGGFDVYVSIESSGTGWQLGLVQPPTTTTLDVLRITYMAGWTDVIDDKSPITIHPSLEPLLSEVVREYAAGLELHDLDQRLGAFVGGALMRSAKMADASAQRMLGQIQGGAVASMQWRWDPWRVETQVLPP